MLQPGDEYDPETFVIKRKKDRVVLVKVEEQTRLSETDKANKHIQYFLKLNPNWESVNISEYILIAIGSKILIVTCTCMWQECH